MMKVNINYNPYFMKTEIEVNGKDIIKDSNYSKFVKYIEKKIPLQAWLDPIPHDGWKGIIEELIQDSGEANIELKFTGREIDHKDIVGAINAQNRGRELKDKVSVKYKTNFNISDSQLGENIDIVVNEMLSKEFKTLIKEYENSNKSSTSLLREKYNGLEENYKRAKSKEFKIIFAGLYSSGKSTFINSVLGKNILPTSDSTCTSKIFKIKHKKDVEFAEIMAIDKNGKTVLQKEVHTDEKQLSERLDKIFPTGKRSNPPEIDEMEVYTDLSHLYPKGFENKFNIVIVDTPGTNSGIGNDESQEEKHIDITLDAIQAEEKEMVIMVVDGQGYQDASMGQLLDAIAETSQEDHNSFNDRFLFLMNKSDNKKYKTGESIETAIEEYARYLKGGETKSRLITPRIFPVCAIGAIAVKTGYTCEENIETQEGENIFGDYESFRKKCQSKFSADNFQFEKHCSTSEHIKYSLKEELEKNKTNEPAQVLIHSGVPSVEIAIKEYIERYAYPIKVKGLLDTFKSILTEVKVMTEAYGEKLSAAIYNMDNVEAKKKQQEKEKNEKEKNTKKLKYAKEEVELLKDEISKIKFNPAGIRKLRAKMDLEVSQNPIIQKARTNSKLSSQEEANNVVKDIHGILNSQMIEIEKDIKRIQKDTVKDASQIHHRLNEELEKFEEEGLFKIGNIDFTKSVVFQDYLKVDSVNKLSSKIAKETKRVQKLNPIKNESYGFFQFIKKMKQKRAPDTITITETVYDISFIETDVSSLLKEFNKLYDAIVAEGENYIKVVNKEVCKRFDNIFELMHDFKEELIRREDLIKELIVDEEKAKLAKLENEEKIGWLNSIVLRIEDTNN